MAGIQNNIEFAGGFKLQASSSRDISDMQTHPTDVANINHTGSPEGVISANPSSLCHDPVSGIVYFKQSGTGNTGWAAIGTGSGTVTSVSGTANRITSTGGATPVIDISASYVGQSSITTLGTITTGVWNGTAVDATHGGTNQTTWATGDILYASGVNTLSKLAAGSNTQVLTLAAGVPSWATPTTGTVTSVSGTANRITSTGGATPVIDISASYVGQSSITTLGTITTGVWNGTAVDATHGGTNQTTWATGDILYASGVNTLAKLAAGSNTQVLTLAGGVPTWAAAAAGTVTSVSGTTNRITSTGGATPVIDISASYVGQSSITTLGTITTGVWNGTAVDATHGGTNQTTWTTGDLLYASGSNTLSKLAIGSSGQTLQVSGGVPIWATDGGGGFLSASGTLTNAQVKALHGTPIQAIAAPGSGNVIVVVNAVGKLNYGGSNAFTAGASQSIQVWYGTNVAVGQSSTNILNNTALTSTSSQIGVMNGGGGGIATFTTAYSNVNNVAINIYNPIATEITGNAANNNTISWQIEYYVIAI